MPDGPVTCWVPPQVTPTLGRAHRLCSLQHEPTSLRWGGPDHPSLYWNWDLEGYAGYGEESLQARWRDLGEREKLLSIRKAEPHKMCVWCSQPLIRKIHFLHKENTFRVIVEKKNPCMSGPTLFKHMLFKVNCTSMGSLSVTSRLGQY